VLEENEDPIPEAPVVSDVMRKRQLKRLLQRKRRKFDSDIPVQGARRSAGLIPVHKEKEGKKKDEETLTLETYSDVESSGWHEAEETEELFPNFLDDLHVMQSWKTPHEVFLEFRKMKSLETTKKHYEMTSRKNGEVQLSLS